MRSLVVTVVIHVVALLIVAPVLALILSPSSETESRVFAWAIVAGLFEICYFLLRSAGKAETRRRLAR
jgi:hypothetical protein